MIIWAHGTYLKYAIDKYGKEYFIKEILFECSSEEEMNNKERELVNEEFIARDDTYNLTVGGNGSKRRGQLLADKLKNPEYHKEFSEKLKNRYHELLKDEKWRTEFSKRISQGLKNFYSKNHDKHPMLGKHHNDETKKKIGQATSIAQHGARKLAIR